jgi:hypothetical protein
MSARLTALMFVLATLTMLACGGTRPEATTSVASTTASSSADGAASGTDEARHPPSPAVVDLWRARCNQCHVPVQPGTRERAALRPALQRHKKRARLSESDVDELVDYLAK